METNKQIKKVGVLDNLSAFADKDAVCGAVSNYSSKVNYDSIRDQISEKIMEIASPEAWRVYDSDEKGFIIGQIVKEIRGLK